MFNEQYVGKIKDIEFGLINDYSFGFLVTLSFAGYEAQFIKAHVAYPKPKRMSQETYDFGCSAVLKKVAELIARADVRNINQLIGVPVKIDVKDNIVRDFHIFEEVL